MGRHALSDEDWRKIERLLPAERGGRGRPWNSHRRTIDGVLWMLMTGAPWRDLPSVYGPWTSVHGRFNRWARDGTWRRIQEALLQELDENDGVDGDHWFIDVTSIRASRWAAGAGKRGASMSRPTMRWGVLAGVTAPRSISSARAVVFR